MNTVRLIYADSRKMPIPDNAVDCIVTSPPYWGLRKYGDVAEQIGLEPSIKAYVDALVQVFAEGWRVLKPSGSLWLNLGDCYSGITRDNGMDSDDDMARLGRKNLIGIPWRVAFALQDFGWILREDIVWAKKNTTPESSKDRCTRSHEFIFHFAKDPHAHYFDYVAIEEPAISTPKARTGRRKGGKSLNHETRTVRGLAQGAVDGRPMAYAMRRKRDVWFMSTGGYRGAHFATFTEELPETCIKAGTSERGVCPLCGVPYRRDVVKKAIEPAERVQGEHANEGQYVTGKHNSINDPEQAFSSGIYHETIGWSQMCACGDPERLPDVTGAAAPALEPVPAVVLDPFCGSGTTCAVAYRLGRSAIGLDTNLEYLMDLARKRVIEAGYAAARVERADGTLVPEDGNALTEAVESAAAPLPFQPPPEAPAPAPEPPPDPARDAFLAATKARYERRKAGVPEPCRCGHDPDKHSARGVCLVSMCPCSRFDSTLDLGMAGPGAAPAPAVAGGGRGPGEVQGGGGGGAAGEGRAAGPQGGAVPGVPLRRAAVRHAHRTAGAVPAEAAPAPEGPDQHQALNNLLLLMRQARANLATHTDTSGYVFYVADEALARAQGACDGIPIEARPDCPPGAVYLMRKEDACRAS